MDDMSTDLAHHRCDRCGAQALVRVRLASTGSLVFCGHHFRANEDALITSGASIELDERHTIEPQAVGVAR